MTDLQAKARLVANQTEWEQYERGMAERGSGCTREQMIGAAVALEWAKGRIAQALRAEREACAQVADSEREAWQKIYAPDGEEAAYNIAAAIRQGRT